MTEGEFVIRRTEEDGVETLTLKNPPVNALSTRVLADLDSALDALEQAQGVRAVILTGDGTYFSAGADLKEMVGMDAARAREVVSEGQRLFQRIAQMPPPVIAAINGLAVGGGLELALACDLRICGDAARLGAPEVNYGLMPAYGGTQRLPRLVGPAKARELIFTGNPIPAGEALRIGLVNRMVPSGQELRAARDLAHTIASRAPKAVAAAKRAIASGAERSIEEGLRIESEEFANHVLPSTDLTEGIAAFVERRPPKFLGS
ncbi:MAG: enoyl-CoA hydratase-related protein [Thermoplasmata archaeon]|nr:enoyl-CoA hydratase-related protein [Thermoplasmata archaeon]MCI4359995.1 enoyl-CoA hydratase-related protein [Thermoplasmata archaeon]